MSQLKYKTRGMSTYRGKSNVYFVCHPEDFGLYFDSVSDEILEKQNVAIWYREPSENQSMEGEVLRMGARKTFSGEHFSDLSEMHLFVLVVTDRLISSGNEKVDLDIEFAAERNIPILPLLQEAGLEQVFSEKYGNLQILDKNTKDMTALSYEEKLIKFLESVLIGDELLERIRKDFTAHIFVSYRKKDRHYAQRFMQILHSEPSCRDIGIWYDEFLTPGRNFDESIKGALDSCELFVLIVTPNLNEEGNYVKRIEYPEAVKENKPIIPIVFVYTDRAELEKNYPGIPEWINVPNAEIPGAVKTQLEKNADVKRRIEKTEQEWTVEHKYLMGLAYLYGIDVEQSSFKARNLLEEASDAGWIEATEKLVDMWYNGIGVNRNLRLACDQQAFLVAQCYQAFHCSNVDSTLRYVEESLKLADMQMELGELVAARKLYEAMALFQDKYYENYNIMSNHYRHAALGLMNIYMKEGKDDLAKKCSETAVVCSAILYEESGDIQSLIRLAKDYANRAYIYKKQGNIEDARTNIIVALQHVEEAQKKEESARVGLLWSETMIHAGEINLASGLDGKELFEKALPVTKSVAEELKSLEAYLNLISCYGNLGDIAAEQGLVLKAGNYYTEAHVICRKIVKETGSAHAYDALGYTCLRLATCNRGTVIVSFLKEALETYEILVSKYPNDPFYKEKYLHIKELAEGIV